MTLFQSGNFKLHSGEHSSWKIECDVLTDEDIDTLCHLLLLKVGYFKYVYGVPTGGLRIAERMRKYVTAESRHILLVDDVWTTGDSMKKYHISKLGSEIVNYGVFFNRSKNKPDNLYSVWDLNDN